MTIKSVAWGLAGRCLLIAGVVGGVMMLAGCERPATLPVPPSTPAVSGPAAIADKTVLDEKLMVGVELAYKAMRFLMEGAVDAGLLKGGSALVAAQMDLRAVMAVDAVRAAYDAGNADSYFEAIQRAYDAIDAARDVVGGK